VTLFGILLVAVFGLMIGSFLNVCISRLPRGASVAFPGSHCPSCGAAIRWYDNIPVISYVALNGRCRSCRGSISFRYPMVEVTTGVAFAVQAMVAGDDPVRLAVRLVFTALLIVLFGTDLETQRLPNVLTVPGIALGALFSVWMPPGLIASLTGAALGGGILLGLRWLWRRFTGVNAMGLGDVKMLAMIGAFLGWQQVWLVLLLASLSGSVLGIALIAFRAKTMKSRLPFGTLLAVAAFIASVAGERLLTWYVGRL